MIPEIQCIVESDNKVGETPVWSAVENAIYWIDVVRPTILRYDFCTKDVDTMELSETIGSIGLRKQGGLVAAMRTGFYLVDFTRRSLEHIIDPEPGQPNNTLNDGRCDRQGRFWAGSGWYALDEEDSEARLPSNPTAALYRLDKDRSCHRILGDIIETNTIAWSPDDTVMYVGDSGTGLIYAYDFESLTGTVSNGRVFVETYKGNMFHDGSAVDGQGYMWTGIWNGSRIHRYAPNGELIQQIEMPVRRPIAMCFGGPNMSTLFVTTANWEMSDEEKAAEPLAGSLLAFDTGIQGMPEAAYEG